MGKIRFAFLLLLATLGLSGCEDNAKQELNLKDWDAYKFYPAEIIPDSYLKIYGSWKLYNVSGGFSGTGHPLNFDFLELKSIGIYGLIRNDSLLEYGKVIVKTFDLRQPDVLQVELTPEYQRGNYPLFFPYNKYVYLNGSDSMDLNSTCCDMYNYHFVRQP